jgi:hypothetical protein
MLSGSVGYAKLSIAQKRNMLHPLDLVLCWDATGVWALAWGAPPLSAPCLPSLALRHRATGAASGRQCIQPAQPFFLRTLWSNWLQVLPARFSNERGLSTAYPFFPRTKTEQAGVSLRKKISCGGLCTSGSHGAGFSPAPEESWGMEMSLWEAV